MRKITQEDLALKATVSRANTRNKSGRDLL